jgi:hypothetical protein
MVEISNAMALATTISGPRGAGDSWEALKTKIQSNPTQSTPF